MYALSPSRQVDELQELVEKLKVELAAKGDNTGPSSVEALELENLKHLELIAELKLQLEQVHFLWSILDCTPGNCQVGSGRRVLTGGGASCGSCYRVQRSRRCRRVSVSNWICS